MSRTLIERVKVERAYAGMTTGLASSLTDSGRPKRSGLEPWPMSVETSRLEEKGRELGEAIADLPEYESFERTKKAVEESDEAQELIAEFERERAEFVRARQSGDASQDDLMALQRKQQELHQVPVMADYLEAQAELEARLEQVNEAISEPLALDFGEFAGGCCQD